MSRKTPVSPDLLSVLEKTLPRRDFLRWSAAFGLLASCRSTLGSQLTGAEQDIPNLDGRGRKVVILGGGPAGLCAAYNLDKMGFMVTVLEKTKRVSGRVWTDYNFFEDGQYCELGATRIPDCHTMTTGYAKTLGLELAPLSHGDQDNYMYFLDGVRRYKKQGSDERAWDLDRGEIESSYSTPAFSVIGDPALKTWPRGPNQMDPKHINRLDHLTLAAYLKELGYSDFARKIVRSANGSEIDMYSALAWLAGEYLERTWNMTYRIKGGNQQLAEQFAKKLSPKAKLETLADVKKVIQTKDAVTVHYQQRGDAKELQADYVICTLPLDVLKKVTWEPGLSKGKMTASQEVPMQAVTRVNLQFKSRFWEKAPYNVKGLKVLHSDLVVERLWDMTGSEDQKYRTGKPSEKGILTSYIQFDNARLVGSREQDDRVKFVLEEVSKAFPEAKREFIKGMSFLWHGQDWIGGGWSAYKPGQIDLFIATRETEGRVHFAGDHTSPEPGWIQGAFSSVHRVIEELDESIKKTS